MIRFNPETNRAEDVSNAVAQELLRRLGLEGRTGALALEDFIDRHAGRDRQLTLRLALAPLRPRKRLGLELSNTITR